MGSARAENVAANWFNIALIVYEVVIGCQVGPKTRDILTMLTRMASGYHTQIPVPRTPRVLWIELTSKCPFDCVFCSRKFRRGSGQHLPFPIYQRLIDCLVDPRKLVLNYSGESTYYPELIPAIELACARGAFVELVSAFSTIQPDLMQALASVFPRCSGLCPTTLLTPSAAR